jgi:glucose/arabinose dehydrogenase
MRSVQRLLAVLATAALLAPVGAAASPQLVPVGTFDNPMYVTAPPGDRSRLFVVERAGTVRVVADGARRPGAFLDLSGQVGLDGERGLLSIAFAPDYATSGLVYSYLAAAGPVGQLQVREYRAEPAGDRVDPASERIVWRQDHGESPFHNGGTIAFGPDGMLWIATGDGGVAPESAQDLSSQLGKVLRIDPRPNPFAIPPDNPFGTTVIASGLRNPFRWSFDRARGDLLIGDVGQNDREEVDFLARDRLLSGADFGWVCREGTIQTPGQSCDPSARYVPPVLDYAHPVSGSRAIAGGNIVRDPGLPTLLGRYLYADTYVGDIRSLVPSTGGDDRSTGLTAQMIVGFGEDGCGHVHVVSLDGPVYRIQDGAPSPCPSPPGGGEGPPGGGEGPPADGPPTVPPAAPDVAPPRLRVSLERRQAALRRGLRLRVACAEACSLTVAARIAGVASFRRETRSVAAGQAVQVRLKLSRRGSARARRALRRHRRLTARVELTARDAAGNTSRHQRRVEVRP